jgi:hypothetical protein
MRRVFITVYQSSDENYPTFAFGFYDYNADRICINLEDMYGNAEGNGIYEGNAGCSEDLDADR